MSFCKTLSYNILFNNNIMYFLNYIDRKPIMYSIKITNEVKQQIFELLLNYNIIDENKFVKNYYNIHNKYILNKFNFDKEIILCNLQKLNNIIFSNKNIIPFDFDNEMIKNQYIKYRNDLLNMKIQRPPEIYIKNNELYLYSIDKYIFSILVEFEFEKIPIIIFKDDRDFFIEYIVSL